MLQSFFEKRESIHCRRVAVDQDDAAKSHSHGLQGFGGACCAYGRETGAFKCVRRQFNLTWIAIQHTDGQIFSRGGNIGVYRKSSHTAHTRHGTCHNGFAQNPISVDVPQNAIAVWQAGKPFER